MEHVVTEEKQGEYHHTIGPFPEPILEVESGDRVVFETKDAFGGKIKDEETTPSEVLEGSNPVNGPVFVEDAEKGDALKVSIESIKPRGDQPRGTTRISPNFGGLAGTERVPTLGEPLPEIVKKVEVTEDAVIWDDEVTLPYKPLVGTIATSPEIDSINTMAPGKHGGNMDLPDVRPGAAIYLPVRVSGALLYLGDCHAIQGDGELNGTAIEQPTRTTVKVELVKGWDIKWPRLENEDFIMSIGSTRPLENAAKIAYADLIDWMVTEYGFDKWNAYMLLTQIGKVRLANMVDPNYTIGASIDKEYLT